MKKWAIAERRLLSQSKNLLEICHAFRQGLRNSRGKGKGKGIEHTIILKRERHSFCALKKEEMPGEQDIHHKPHHGGDPHVDQWVRAIVARCSHASTKLNNSKKERGETDPPSVDKAQRGASKGADNGQSGLEPPHQR